MHNYTPRPYRKGSMRTIPGRRLGHPFKRGSFPLAPKATLCRPTGNVRRNYATNIKTTSGRQPASVPPPLPYKQQDVIRSTPAAVHATSTPESAMKKPKLSYDSVYRRVLAAMVAAPILIVTSYELYQRLVLGRAKKILPDRSVSQTEDRYIPPPENVTSAD